MFGFDPVPVTCQERILFRIKMRIDVNA